MPTIGFPTEITTVQNKIQDLAKDIAPSWARLVPSEIFPDQWLYVNENGVAFVLIDTDRGAISVTSLGEFEWVIRLAIAIEKSGLFDLDPDGNMVKIYLSKGPFWIKKTRDN